ncbi:phage portal protein [Micrococcales bacterium 31B]|nr:phage portal protein [Micrococcales bacterium 31B]
MLLDVHAVLRSVNDLYHRLEVRRVDVSQFGRYYRGEQPLKFASREWSDFVNKRYVNFSDNWCGPVANASVERLRPTGILTSDKELNREVLEDFLRLEGEAQASQGLLKTAIDSRSFALVWGDDDGPTLTWETAENIIVDYDPARFNHPRAALKTWRDGTREYGYFYTADYVYKMVRSQAAKVKDGVTDSGLLIVSNLYKDDPHAGWAPEEVDGEPWPLPNPMGEVPIVEYPNRPVLGEEPISEIGGTMAMQDAVNLLWAYLFNAADHASLDARVVMGQERPKVPILDENGQKIGEQPIDLKELRHGRLMWLSNPSAKIDSWSAANLATFTEVIEVCVAHIASQTRTPPTYLVAKSGMSNLSGDAITAAESGLVQKSLEAITYLTPSQRRLHRLIALAKGDYAAARLIATAKMDWANPGVRSEAQVTDANVKRRSMGYPLRYLLELEGKDPIEVDRVMEMAEREMDLGIADEKPLMAGGEVQASDDGEFVSVL